MKWFFLAAYLVQWLWTSDDFENTLLEAQGSKP